MSNIEVGEYVRSKQGYIAKVTSTSEEIICFDSAIQFYYEEDWTLLGNELDKVKAHSKNIIDLIEVGDYVNGELIREISPNGKVLFYLDYDIDKMIENGDIERVLTKEKFKEMEYRIYDN